MITVKVYGSPHSESIFDGIMREIRCAVEELVDADYFLETCEIYFLGRQCKNILIEVEVPSIFNGRNFKINTSVLSKAIGTVTAKNVEKLQEKPESLTVRTSVYANNDYCLLI